MDAAINESIGLKVAAGVDSDRLWERHMVLAAFGQRPDGGVNRQALSAEDIEARKQLLAWTDACGYQAFIDPVGNLFIRREGRRADLPPIVTGSHLDSQPAGGKFDGVFGVLAGLEVLQALDSSDVSTERAVEIVVWTNEEGSRFSPGMSGSLTFAGALSFEKAIEVKDEAGQTFADALSVVLDAFSYLPKRPLGFPLGAYVEAHIEQGPTLEHARCLVGAVSGIQGTRWFSVRVQGKAMHAGTVPSRMRKDAFKATTAIVEALDKLFVDEEDLTRFTVGRVLVEPNSPNTIPGAVTFSIDFRHPDAGVLAKAGDQIAEVCSLHARGCSVTVEETLNSPPIVFPPLLVDQITRAADHLGITAMVLPSGAFHDARSVSRLCPTGMIFVPCAEGVSHSPDESVEPDALAAGTRVLAATIAELAQSESIVLSAG